ncbi:MAG: cellulose synthase complex periplasmic endoglucanase BcsZ [Acidobacteriaceae bacterium]
MIRVRTVGMWSLGIALGAALVLCAMLCSAETHPSSKATGASARPASAMPLTPVAWPLWSAYAARFINSSGRVIDHDTGDRTTSEGQAYAMFFSLVVNDRAQFDKLLSWTAQNLAQGDLTAHLPAWEWGHAADGSWRILDTNSAADADLWISYTLIQAGNLWREPRYRSLGVALAALIAERESTSLPGLGPVLLPAASGFRTADHWILNPSYSPLPVLTGIAHAMPHGPWPAMANGLPQFLQRSSIHGFAMDWVSYDVSNGCSPAVLSGSPKDSVAVGSYDAIRVYLWAGMAPRSMPGAQAVLHAVYGMNSYLAAHPIPPRGVDGAGKITAENGGVGFSAALLPYLANWRAKDQLLEQQNRVDALLDPATGLFGSPPMYYDQNLALFAEGFQQNRYHFSTTGELHVAWGGDLHHRSSARKPGKVNGKR